MHATALNMTNMIGIGPFITIPLLMSALGGPQAMLGWLVALVIVLCDSTVWSELGAALPGSGGSFGYLRQGYGAERVGRLMGFLFVWQFVLSGPLEIASGYIGFSQYLGYIWKGITRPQTLLVVTLIGLVNIALLYRRIKSIATITVTLWIGTIVTVVAVVATGALHFDPEVAFDFPPGAFTFSLGFLMGLGAASRIGVYDYLGYYDVCYIGDEVENPGRVIPRSILISTIAVAAIYVAINLSIIGVVPWRDFVPAASHPESNFIVSSFMERIYGPGVATIFTAMILWTAFGSVFALLLGYSRVPYAAARDGYFFKVFARLHPSQGFPYVSLIVLGVLSILAGFVSLGVVIDALITTRILVQFIGQIGAVTLLRRRAPDMPRPYRMWLYPLPSLVALLGWIFIFATTPPKVIAFGLAALALGAGCFAVWSWKGRTWPFAAACVLALGASLGCAPNGPSTPPPPPVTGEWVLVWGDEFEGTAGAPIDTTTWRYDTADGCAAGNCGWGNNEKEYYSNATENIALNGQGQLTIVARRAPAGLTCYYGPCRYTSAKITTRGKVEVAPGRVEGRIKLPVGQGLWPAFWMLGHGVPATPWPYCGELDIMENRGSAPTITSSAVHGPGYSGNTPFARAHALAHGTAADTFHTFAVEWDSLRIRFFVDDGLHYTVTRDDVRSRGPWVFDQSFFVILNLAVGGNFDGDPQSDAMFPATMFVDYVRVYKWERRS
ncbi:MAG TPA: amino acid permease [Gemmatimonadales bacterium]|nr:amino acid permease [Gemmatimonadales bacterium]